jgi:hypothetical protein
MRAVCAQRVARYTAARASDAQSEADLLPEPIE